MRRSIGVVLAATVALAPYVARAQLTLPSPKDFRTAFLLRLFAEVSDGRASFAASNGDERSESPLRDAAFVVRIEPMATDVEQFNVVADDEALLRIATVRIQLPSYAQRAVHEQTRVAERIASPTPVTSAYETAPPTLFASAGTNKFSFMSAPSDTIPAFVTQSALNDSNTIESQLEQSLQVPLTVRLGNTQLLAGFNAGQASLPSTGLENTLPVFVPAYAGVNRSDLGANFAVPVTSRLLFGLGYNTEHLVTGYGMPTYLDGLDARNDTYSGNLTFFFPRLSSAVSLSAQQYRYQDNLVPAEFTQLREDLNLTVKF